MLVRISKRDSQILSKILSEALWVVTTVVRVQEKSSALKRVRNSQVMDQACKEIRRIMDIRPCLRTLLRHNI